MDKNKSTEWLNEDKQELNEAPASATVKIRSSRGFEWLFTIRDTEASQLSRKMAFMEDFWLKDGFTPLAQSNYSNGQPKASTAPSNLASMKCENCNGPMAWSEKKQKAYCQSTCWLKK